MAEGRDPFEQRLGRDDFLKLAAAVGGAALSSQGRAAASAARTRLAAESGRLQVLDWAGYGNDGGQAMFAAYVKAHPKNKPQFTT
jgi:NAD(P)H-hydrate repair Nnr-like enzyme with NAD(P)H-hydrate epimerase domain